MGGVVVAVALKFLETQPNFLIFYSLSNCLVVPPIKHRTALIIEGVVVIMAEGARTRATVTTPR